MNKWRTVLVVPAALVLAACAGLSLENAYQSPTFDHQQTRLTGLTWNSLQGRSTVELHNPNPFGLPVSKLQAGLWLEGEHWLDLETPRLDGLAGDAATVLAFDWEMSVPGLIERARAAYEAGAADLELRLVSTFDVPVLGERQVNWRHGFTQPVPKTPSVRMAGWELESLSLSQITLNLDLQLSNPNRFSLATGPWSLKATASERELSGVNLDPLSIPAGETRQHRTRLTLSTGQLGPALLHALRSGNWPESLSMEWRGQVSSPELGLDLPPLEGRVAF